MKKIILLMIALMGLMLLFGCAYQTQSEIAYKFCKTLELEDYYYDCSEWRNLSKEYNTTTLSTPYLVNCEFESKKGIIENGYDEYGCGIDYLLENYTIVYNNCAGNILEEAFQYCKEKLPEELEGIRIIEPKYNAH